MAVPYHVIQAALTVLSAVREVETTKRTAMMARVRELEITAQREANAGTKEILLAVLTAIEGVANRRMDLAFETFRQTQSLISAHHTSLIAERDDLRQRRWENASDDKILAFNQRLSEIKVELLDLSKSSAILTIHVNRIASEIGTEFRMPTLILPN